MLDIQQKRKFRNFIYHRFTLIFLLIITLLVLNSTFKIYLKNKESRDLLFSAQNRLNDLQNRDYELEQKIKKISTQSGVEEEIRTKFSVAKEEENMVVIVKDGGLTPTTTPKSKGIFSWFKGLF